MKNCDKDFEGFILGAVLNDGFAQNQALQNLEVKDFYFPEHQTLFKAFRRISEEGVRIDLFGVLKFLSDSDTLKLAGGSMYVESLMKNNPSVDVEYYIQKIKELSSRRSLLHIAHDISIRAFDSNIEAVDLIEKYAREITSIGTYSRDQFVDVNGVIQNYKDNKDMMTVLQEESFRASQGEDLFEGVRTYYPRLDNLIGGFTRGSSTIIGARSSSGKTTFLANLFLNIHKFNPDIRMGFFSLEMSKTKIAEKIICCMGGISYKNMQERQLTPTDFDNLANAQEGIQSMKLKIFDRAGININDFKTAIRRETIQHGLDIVFLDYLSLLQSSHRSSSKHQEVDQVSKGIQQIGLELNVAMVTLAQLNRAIYGRTDKTPVLSDLRESGSIEEDADTVLLLHRPIHYLASNAPKIQDLTQCIVAKNRLRGDLGKVSFSFFQGRYIEEPTIEEMLPNQVVSGAETKEEWRPPSSY